VENRTADFQAACGRVLCVHSGGSVHGIMRNGGPVRRFGHSLERFECQRPVHQLLNHR
jgi:hypothetical protein